MDTAVGLGAEFAFFFVSVRLEGGPATLLCAKPSPRVVGEVDEGEYGGYDEEYLAFGPAYGLLVPEAGDDAEYG